MVRLPVSDSSAGQMKPRLRYWPLPKTIGLNISMIFDKNHWHASKEYWILSQQIISLERMLSEQNDRQIILYTPYGEAIVMNKTRYMRGLK
jgi:hypothetical protein